MKRGKSRMRARTALSRSCEASARRRARQQSRARAAFFHGKRPMISRKLSLVKTYLDMVQEGLE